MVVNVSTWWTISLLTLPGENDFSDEGRAGFARRGRAEKRGNRERPGFADGHPGVIFDNPR